MKKLPKINSEVGAVPILLLVAAVGLLIYLFATNTFSFKDRLFNTLFPKPPSKAAQVAESVPDEIIIKFKAGVDEKVKDNIRAAHGLTKKDEITQIGVERVKVPEKVKDKILEALKNNPRVEYAEPNVIAQLQDVPNDPYFVQQWQLSNVKASPAWDIFKGSSSVTIAVLDTGVYSGHEDLTGKLLPGYNYRDNNTDTSDVHGHGTLVAGIAGAATNNTKGVASLGRNITVMPFKVCTDTGACGFYEAAQSLIYAADHGAKVANMSFGASIQDNTLQSAIDYAWGKNMVVVAAAGNSGTTPILYPASGNHTMAVGGTDQTDKWATVNYGSGLDVMAPMSHESTNKAGGYSGVSGTSFASPMTGALAGLIISANPSLTNQQVVDIIIQTADKVDASVYGGYDSNGWNDHFGFGRINASSALQKATGITFTPDTAQPTVTLTNALSEGAVISGILDVAAATSDNVGVVRVTFAIQDIFDRNVLQVDDYASPYTASFDTTSLTNGQYNYRIVVTAFDNAGNSAQAATKQLSVNNPTSSDTIAPAISITSPAGGATVSGNTNISVSATDNVALSTISIFVDGNVVTSCPVSGTSSNCSYSLDTTQISNGSHTILSKALDSSNNLGQSSTVTVNVQNVTPTPAPTPISTPSPAPTPSPIPSPTPSDTTPPTISITNPLDGSTVKVNSKVNITASATDNAGISKVEFYVNSSLKCASSVTPYTCTWPVPGKKNTSYIIQAKAYDGVGNSSSAAIKVTSQ